MIREDFFTAVDRILVDLCAESPVMTAERGWIVRRMHKWQRLPVNAALALCEAREQAARKEGTRS